MRPYQTKFFNDGYTAVMNSTRNNSALKSDELIALMNEIISVRTTMRAATLQHDKNQEPVGSVSEEFSTCEALGYELAGRMTAMCNWINAAMEAPVNQ